VEKEMSRVQDAIAYMREHNVSANKAAEEIEVRVSAVYAALKRERVRLEKSGLLQPCPCCSSMVDPKKINREVLK
jgi:hypothetical protein